MAIEGFLPRGTHRIDARSIEAENCREVFHLCCARKNGHILLLQFLVNLALLCGQKGDHHVDPFTPGVSFGDAQPTIGKRLRCADLWDEACGCPVAIMLR